MKHTHLVAAVLACLLGTAAHAQFKVVGPDGKITFTDRVPDASQGRVSNVAKNGTEVAAADLPYELRQVVQKFPVTLFTASDCDPCNQARELLQRRGVPFQERTATTPEDRGQWQKVTGSSEAPMMTVGKQQVKSFSLQSWNELLDTAGYPATSKLPINYRQPATQPLVAREAPKAKPAPGPADSELASTPSGPGGIRF